VTDVTQVYDQIHAEGRGLLDGVLNGLLDSLKEYPESITFGLLYAQVGAMDRAGVDLLASLALMRIVRPGVDLGELDEDADHG